MRRQCVRLPRPDFLAPFAAPVFFGVLLCDFLARLVLPPSAKGKGLGLLFFFGVLRVATITATVVESIGVRRSH
eukprot:COSAG02_NODE_50_length_44860_cov_203.992739_26_plen_74_part_00